MNYFTILMLDEDNLVWRIAGPFHSESIAVDIANEHLEDNIYYTDEEQGDFREIMDSQMSTSDQQKPFPIKWMTPSSPRHMQPSHVIQQSIRTFTVGNEENYRIVRYVICARRKGNSQL